MSHPFEELCGSALRTLYPDYTITDTGQWWYREHELDVVGFTTGSTLITGECKFQRSPVGYDAFASLREHTSELRWTPREGGDRTHEYALFSRTGFKPPLRGLPRNETTSGCSSSRTSSTCSGALKRNTLRSSSSVPARQKKIETRDSRSYPTVGY